MEKNGVLNLIENAIKHKQLDLDLSFNRKISHIAYLPPEIGNLTNLTKLNLYGNQLTSLPPEIGNLMNLKELDLTINPLTSLPPEIGNLTNLTKLNLHANKLTSLPPEIGNLANLTELNLYVNQLTSLPPEIGNLTNLTKLNLYGNKLTSLPPEFGNLTNLEELQLSNNPLTSLPPEIVKQGTWAIFEYVHQLLEKTIVHNEAKLLIVGQGDVGKTCLAKRLTYDRFLIEKTTEGIDISEWSIPAPTAEKEKIKLNVWDFGGQEIYHATHQFFLTKRSVYLLVWNARKSRDYEQIYYWLHIIEAFGEDSPIILVMSKLNERDEDLNMKDLREKFPQIVGLYKVDSEDGKGIPRLKEIISQTAWYLPHMRTNWVESWFKIRESLEEDGRDWINYSEFNQLCETKGLDKKQTDILDGYLHDLGVIIHFRDRIGLRNMVILKPDWATNAFYKILDTHSVRERGGILLHNELEQIWDTNIYPQDIHPKLLELMNKFELAYGLPDKNSHLVAELLPSTQPDFEWNSTENLQFYYCYDFLPAGVMTRFIVLVHKDLEKKSNGIHFCWKEGAVLEREGARAFVKVKPLERMLEIKIYGDKKRELLAIIRRELDHINNSIKKVKIIKEIPCICSEDCPHRFNYEQLLIAEKCYKETVDCPVSWNEVSLLSLLEGYERKELLKETDEILGGKRTLNIAVSPHMELKSEINPHMELRSSIKVETNVDINLKIDLPEVQSDFESLRDILIQANPHLERNLNEICDSLDEISADTEKEKLIKPFNKLARFLKKLSDENSDIHKITIGTKKGIEYAQKVGKSYNKFAQWLALPQVPDLFVSK